MRPLENSPKLRQRVKAAFKERAQGTILWVGIMAKEIEQSTAAEVERNLELFPPGLDAVYERLLHQITPTRRQTAAKILR